jgi:hypothetical protein
MNGAVNIRINLMNKIGFTIICHWKFIANQGRMSVTIGGSGRRDIEGMNLLQKRVGKNFFVTLSLT